MINFDAEFEALPLTDQVERLQAEFDRLELQSPRDTNYYNLISNKLNEKKAMLEQSQAHEERVQSQEQKVREIKLSYDLNEVFDDPRANDIVIEMIQIDRRQSYEEHNDEIEKLHTYYKEQLRAANDREIQLQQQNDELQEKNKKLAETNNQLASDNAQLQLDKQDAESKRDAAVAEAEAHKKEIDRLNSHIDDLRKEAAVGAQNAYKVTDIGTSDRLSQLVKESAADKANRALARWSQMVPDIVAPPTLPEVTESPFRGETEHNPPESAGDQLPSAEVADEVAQFQAEPPSVPAVQLPSEQPMEQMVGEETPITSSQLEARLQQFAQEHGLVKGQVA